MNTPNAIQAAYLDRHFARSVDAGLGTSKGYASSRSMERALAPTIEAIRERGLGDRLLVVEITAGKHAGRVTPCLYFGEREEVTQEAICFAFAGVLIFRESRSF